MADADQAALETLCTPFRTGALQWSVPAAFLGARFGQALADMPDTDLVCEQPFKPDAAGLLQAGFEVSRELDRRGFPLVLVLPPRQREQARALLARAVRMALPNGRIVAASANSSGARTHEADLERLCGKVESLSKNKCRAFWATLGAQVDEKLLKEWLGLDAPRPILDGRFVSRPGVFAWDRIDAASELLVANLPTTLAGRAADLGAGYGFLSVELLRTCPGISSLDLYEADARALELAKINVGAVAAQVPVRYHWHDVTEGLSSRYDVIVTNPPFHSPGGSDDPGLGRRFIAAAADALNPGGTLFLVANRHLPYEDILNARFGSMRVVVQQYGFKIIAATRSPKGSPT
jgi:16S rRNA (guanine1207-N2)-methyltransferase